MLDPFILPDGAGKAGMLKSSGGGSGEGREGVSGRRKADQAKEGASMHQILSPTQDGKLDKGLFGSVPDNSCNVP